MNVTEITGADLRTLVSIAQFIVRMDTEGRLYQVSTSEDGGFKIKVNEDTWSPPLGQPKAGAGGGAQWPVDAETFKRTAPKWNCVDYPGNGMHYVPLGSCAWCGMTREQITAEAEAAEAERIAETYADAAADQADQEV